jgi:hypothetical protein
LEGESCPQKFLFKTKSQLLGSCMAAAVWWAVAWWLDPLAGVPARTLLRQWLLMLRL